MRAIQDWVINSQAVGSSETSLRYLARYVSRVAISNNHIISYKNHMVLFCPPLREVIAYRIKQTNLTCLSNPFQWNPKYSLPIVMILVCQMVNFDSGLPILIKAIQAFRHQI